MFANFIKFIISKKLCDGLFWIVTWLLGLNLVEHTNSSSNAHSIISKVDNHHVSTSQRSWRSSMRRTKSAKGSVEICWQEWKLWTALTSFCSVAIGSLLRYSNKFSSHSPVPAKVGTCYCQEDSFACKVHDMRKTSFIMSIQVLQVFSDKK